VGAGTAAIVEGQADGMPVGEGGAHREHGSMSWEGAGATWERQRNSRCSGWRWHVRRVTWRARAKGLGGPHGV